MDQKRLEVPKHPDANLYPSAVVTLALLHAIQGGETCAFSRWLTRDDLALFPQIPERTRLVLSSNINAAGFSWRPGPCG